MIKKLVMWVRSSFTHLARMDYIANSGIGMVRPERHAVANQLLTNQFNWLRTTNNCPLPPLILSKITTRLINQAQTIHDDSQAMVTSVEPRFGRRSFRRRIFAYILPDQMTDLNSNIASQVDLAVTEVVNNLLELSEFEMLGCDIAFYQCLIPVQYGCDSVIFEQEAAINIKQLYQRR